MHRTRRGLAAIAAATATLVALTGCILMPPQLPGDPTTPGGPGGAGGVPWSPTGEDVAPELASYYGQDVDWSGCGDNWCGTITAPMDWFSAGDGREIELSVVVAPATGTREGAILYNPGGPGASGVEYVANYAEYLITPDVREHYDLVGFDPRGVGGSTPISCYDDPAELYDWLWEIEEPAGEPLSDADLDQQMASAQWFGEQCLEHTGEFLQFVGTEQVASDMDLMRALLGEQQLNYLGVSYGTLIGSTYADLFPENVGRMVLDAVSSPTATDFDGTLFQAGGFELAYGNFVEDCLGSADCPFTGSKEDALAQTRTLLDEVDANPIPVGDRQLGSGALFTAIASNLYSQSQWRTLRGILGDVMAGDGESAFAAGDEYYGINADGTFADNSLEALIAVNCLDAPAETDYDQIRANAATIMEAAPTLGPDFVGLGTCAAWPFEATRQPHEITAPGANPIIAIGGRNDPATPYEQAVELADMLESGVLISVDAEGHGQYGGGNPCVDGPVDELFLTGVAPSADIDC